MADNSPSLPKDWAAREVQIRQAAPELLRVLKAIYLYVPVPTARELEAMPPEGREALRDMCRLVTELDPPHERIDIMLSGECPDCHSNNCAAFMAGRHDQDVVFHCKDCGLQEVMA